MENVAPVEILAEAGAISQIVATNVAVVNVDSLFRDLAVLRQQHAVVAAERQSFLDKVMAQYEQQFSSYDDNLASLVDRMSNAESAIRDATLKAGKTLKGETLQAVWSKGRVSWDSKGLEGVAAIIPEIRQFRKEGEPSVSIRAVGGAK